jgi:hypothetical protein
MKCNEIAARIHADMVLDESNGYSWEPRHGEDGKGVKTLTIDGKKYSYDRGSWDCSSSVIKAWSEAIKYTPYKGKLDGASYTGNMRDVFTRSGLFEWKPMSFIAARGDLYLNEANHVAMCQSQDPDVMSEFCINENGDVYGGAPGDQTGGEAAINPFRDEFDGILHYNGKADTVSTTTAWKDGTYVATHTLKIREKRGGSSTLVCLVAEGATLKLGKFATNAAGNLWAQVLAGDHKGRYVCVRNSKGTYVKRK